MPNLLELQDLQTESLVREIIEQTKSGGLVWSSLGSAQYMSTEVQTGDPSNGIPDVTWTFYVSKTQIGNLTYKYSLDIKKDGTAYVTPVSGALSYTDRDSEVKDLYEIVEIIVLELDFKLKETIQFVQNLNNWRNPS
jgi:hypothetical protein